MEFELVRKKIKNMYIKIKAGKVIVSAPTSMPFGTIAKFVEEKEEWIKKALQTQTKQLNKKVIDDKVRILGQWYEIREADFFSIQDNVVYVDKKKDAPQQIKKFLRIQLEKIGTYYFDFYYDKMAEYFKKPKLKFSYLKGKWGVCFMRKEEIVLSYDLIHCSEQFIAYVALHELAHMVHPNHSKSFYYFVERYMPNYKEIIKKEKIMI